MENKLYVELPPFTEEMFRLRKLHRQSARIRIISGLGSGREFLNLALQ